MDSPVVSTDHSLRRKLALSPVGITLKSEAIEMHLEDTALHKGALRWFRRHLVEIGCLISWQAVYVVLPAGCLIACSRCRRHCILCLGGHMARLLTQLLRSLWNLLGYLLSPNFLFFQTRNLKPEEKQKWSLRLTPSIFSGCKASHPCSSTLSHGVGDGQ